MAVPDTGQGAVALGPAGSGQQKHKHSRGFAEFLPGFPTMSLLQLPS